MGELSQNEVLVIWSKIEDYYFELFQKLQRGTKLITPEVKKDYFEFRQVMRESVNKSEDPGKLILDAVYQKLSGNTWVPIMVYIAFAGKTKRKPIREMSPSERAAFLRDYEKFNNAVKEEANRIEKGEVFHLQ